MRLHILCKLLLSVLLLADLALAGEEGAAKATPIISTELTSEIVIGAEDQTETAAEPKLEVASEPKPVPEPAPAPKPAAAPEPVPESAPKPVPEPIPVPEPVPEPTPASKPASKPKSTPTPAPPKKESAADTSTTVLSLAISEDPFSEDTTDDEDYGNETEQTKPDNLDDDVIQQLVNQFLNTGETSEGAPQKANKAAAALINSSSYWTLETEPERSIKEAAKAKEWLDGYSRQARKVLHQVTMAGWNYFTAISPLSKQMLNEAEEMLALFVKSTSKQAKQFDLAAVEDPALRRQLEMLSVEGISALNSTEYQEVNDVQSKINKAIAEASICSEGLTPPCILKLVDIPSMLVNERNPATVLYIWKAWRDAVNDAKLAPKYERLMQLTNKGANLTGFKDGGAMWRSPFDLSSETAKPKIDLVKEINKLYEQILPFYKQLHAYFRRQLAAVYSLANSQDLTKDGPMPAHLLKNIINYDWLSFYADTRPFKVDSNYSEEIMEQLHANNMTSKKMFIQAYKYFKSLGFPKLPKSFWTDSLFSKKWTSDMLCQPPTAYDLRDGASYRVKACTQVKHSDFKLAHKLLAQVYYQYSYRRQPLLFQEPANPSFSSALTNAFYITAGNDDYLEQLNLAPADGRDDQTRQINDLYLEALEEFVTLPYDVVVDTWRFNIFEGKTNKNTWNDDWWRLSEHYQGLKAPTQRNSTDFDAVTAAAIARVHSPAIRHFLGYVMQFQILKALCPHQKALNKGCYLQKSDLKNIKKVMSLGSSITWIEALRMITGNGTLDAKPLLEYYSLLINWLENTNEIDQVNIGWDGTGTPFTDAEIPSIAANSSDANRNVLSADQVAYPGDDCSKGQECLLDSTCKNGRCECNEGLYTLKIGKTHNCVPGNPADAGFGENQGGLVIGLFPNDNTNVTDPVLPPTEAVTEPSPEASTVTEAKTASHQGAVWLSVTFCVYHMLTLIRR